MSVGKQFRTGFLMILKHSGGTVLIHKNYGQHNQITTEVKGMKSSANGRPSDVTFQFPDRLEIENGDVLQQKGANELWKVYDFEDHIVADEYNYFDVKVEKVGSNHRSTFRPNIVVNANNYGGTQINASHSFQSVSVSVSVSSSIAKLKELLQDDEISELDREDGIAALDRIETLARKEKTPDVIDRMRDKLGVLNGIFSAAKSLAEIAEPYLETIAGTFGL